MKNFIVLYHAPADAMAQMAQSTPEDQAKGMEAWMSWAQKTGANLVDMGAPLANGTQVTASGSGSSNKNVSGYSIVQAEDMESAKALFEGHPHISGWSPEATIEIHETVQMPGM